jgi:cholesterol transport system auxiliary component
VKHQLTDRARLRHLAPALLLTMLAGCTSLKSAPETYDLSVPSGAGAIAGSSQAQILVPETTALAALNSERIVVMNGSRVSYYPDAQWTDRLPKVLQTKIIQTFEASKRARAAGRPGEGLSIDYQLLTEVRAFQYDAGGDRSARVEIYAKVLNDRNGRVVAAKLFTASVPVQADSGAAVVNALDAALNQVLIELVTWTLPRV